MQTLGRPGEAGLVRRRSRFIACAQPVATVAEAEASLSALRRRYHDARHVVSAWRVFEGREVRERADDAGEPAGSGGTPVLHMLRGEEIVNVAVAVVRYFGGVKLGVGNLARAYREAARAALVEGGLHPWAPIVEIEIEVHPDQVGRLLAVLGQRGAEVRGQTFPGPAVITARLGASDLDELVRATHPWATVRSDGRCAGA